jgi:hypothetical protein
MQRIPLCAHTTAAGPGARMAGPVPFLIPADLPAPQPVHDLAYAMLADVLAHWHAQEAGRYACWKGPQRVRMAGSNILIGNEFPVTI